MTDREFDNLERRVRRAAAKQGYSISRKTIPVYGVGYNVADANNVICGGLGNYEMSLRSVGEWFGVDVPDEDDEEVM